MSRIRGWKDLVQDGVDVVSRTVEKTHRNIARKPFDVLEAIPGVDVPTKGVRVVHDAVLTGVYGSIRLVNRLVGGVADVVIDAVASESESASESAPVPVPVPVHASRRVPDVDRPSLGQPTRGATRDIAIS